MPSTIQPPGNLINPGFMAASASYRSRLKIPFTASSGIIDIRSNSMTPSPSSAIVNLAPATSSSAVSTASYLIQSLQRHILSVSSFFSFSSCAHITGSFCSISIFKSENGTYGMAFTASTVVSAYVFPSLLTDITKSLPA